MDTLSVAMTTHNGERHLSEQLESIAIQEPPPAEVVVGDDASQDRSVAILREFARTAPFPVHVFASEQRRGLRCNLASVLSACHGTVIALCDQDDVWEQGRLEAISAAFSTDSTTTVWFSQAGLIDDVGTSLGRTTWDAVHLSAIDAEDLRAGGQLRRLLFGMTVTGATMAFRRDVLRAALPLPDQLEGPDHLFLHDGWIAVLAASLGRTVADARLLSSYRQHAGQVTAMSMSGDQVGETTSAIDQLRQEYERLELVLGRLRDSGMLGECRARARAELLDLERLLVTRLTPATDWRRLPRIAARQLDGSYRRHARGLRTALADVTRFP